MKTFVKLFASLVTLVLTLLLVVVLVAVNIDPNNHKDWIAGEFRDSTGLDLALNGNIDLTYYPWFGLSLNDVVVGNAPGFSDTPMLEAGHAQVRVKLLPVLSREYEIDTIRLSDTRVYLETNAAGVNNWDYSPAPAAEEAAAVTGGDPVFNRLVLGGVDISNVSLTWDDRFNDVRYEMRDIRAATGELVFGEPVALSLSLTAAASEPALSADINLDGTIVYDLDNQRYDLDPFSLNGTLRGDSVPDGAAAFGLVTAASLDLAADRLTLRDLSLEALNARVNANINGNNVTSGAPEFQVNVAAAGNDLAILFRILENDALVQQITALNSRAFSFSALVESRPASGDLGVSNLEASLLDATITGNIDAANLNGNPVISGALNAAGPDLPTLLEVAGQLQGGDSTLAQYGRELQRAPNQDFSVNTRFDANLETGNIDLPTLEMRLFGADITGNLVATRINTDTPQVRGLLRGSGPDLPLLLQIGGQLTGGRESPLNEYGRQLRGVGDRAFTVDTTFDADMASGNVDISRLNAAFLGFRLDGNLALRNFQAAAGTAAGRLTLSGNNLREVLRAIEQDDLSEVARSMNLRVELNGTRGNLRISPLDLDLVVDSPRITNSPVTLALRAATVANLDADTLAVENFSLTGLGLNLSGAATVNALSTDPNYNASLTLPAFNLRNFARQMNLELPETMDNTVFQSVALATSLRGSGNDLQVSGLDLTLDESRITGNLTLAGLSDAIPATDFDLDITRINLDRYLAPESETPEAADIGNTELPVDTLRDLNLKGRLDIGQIVYSNLTLANLALSVNAAGGQLTLAPMSADLYEGTYAGEIRLDVAGNTPVAAVNTNLAGINLAPLLRDFMDATYVSGTGNIQLALTGSGADTAAIKRNLNGTGGIDLQDGILRGVDVGSVLRQIETMIRSRTPGSVNRGEQTPFETFKAGIAINNGVVTSNDLLIESSGFDISGRGTLVNLADDSIAFNLVASVDESPASDEQQYDIGGYSLPIACTGTLAGPRCLPDIQAILAGALRNAVQRGITDLLQRAVGDQVQEQTGTEDDQETPADAENADPREELINRALDNIFNRNRD